MNNATTPKDAATSPQYDQHSYPEDEIDLTDLVRVLIRKKKIIFLVTILITLGALIFAFRQPAIYQAKSYFRPPTQADVELLNGQLIGYSLGGMVDNGPEFIKNITVSKDDLFQIFQDELQSRSLRREVFAETYPIYKKGENVDHIFENFNKRLSLQLSNGKKKKDDLSNIVSIAFEDNDPQIAANILNILGQRAERKAKETVLLDVEGKINLQKSILNQKIETLVAMKQKEISDEIIRLQEADEINRKTLLEQRKTLVIVNQERINDEIIRLKEADEIKRKTLQEKIAGIKEQSKKIRLDRIARLEEAAAIAGDSQIQNLAGNLTTENLKDNLANMQISMNDLPLYMYGEKVLRAEIKRLKERTDEDPFIVDLRNLEEEVNLLERNETIEALEKRKDLIPFIPEIRDIQNKLIELEKNEKIEALKERKDLVPFIPEVREIQKQLANLEMINLDPNLIRAAIVDQAAYAPKSPIKPKRIMIVALGLILGLMSGVFAAFLMNFVENMRNQEK